MSKASIQSLIEQVRNETQLHGNTRQRIASLLTELNSEKLDRPAVEGIISEITNLSPLFFDQFGNILSSLTQGWTVQFSDEEYIDSLDGRKVIRKVTGYVGGTGTLPAALSANIGKYFAKAGGFTTNKDLATNYKAYANGVVIPKFNDLTFPVTGYIQAVYNGSIYELPLGQTSTIADLPSTSSKWVNLGSNSKIDFLVEVKSEIIANAANTTWVDGEYYLPNGSTGGIGTFSRSTNYMPIIAGHTYGFVSAGYAIVWYNDANTVVGSSGDASDSLAYREWVAPAGATKARVSIITSSKASFEFKHKPLTGEYAIKQKVIKLGDIDGVNVLFQEIANFANSTWVTGAYLDTSGVVNSYAPFSYTSNYIPVMAGQSYTFMSSGISVIWYNSAQAVIGYGGQATDQPLQRIFTAPAGAAFARVNQVDTLKPNFSMRLANSSGGSELVQIPSLQINGNQVIGGLSSGGSDQAKLAKIGDVKLFNFNTYPLTGNVITSGDSTIAAYAGGAAVATIIKATGTITDISVPGETIAQQLAHWNALSTAVKSAVNYVFIQIGLNDVGAGSPDATIIIQNLKNYFAKVRLDSPSGIIVACEMLPCRQRYINFLGETNGEIAYQKWKAINASLPTITQANKVATVHGWLLNDGKDNLKGEFDTGDQIHETTNGRKMIAYSWIISTL